MSEMITLLASLFNKTAIKDAKLEFLAKRDAAKIDAVIPEPEGIRPEQGLAPTDLETVKKENEKLRMEARKNLIKLVAIADPTDAQNKNDFTDWLLKQYLQMTPEDRRRWEEDSREYRETLKSFMELKDTDIFKEKNEAGEFKYKRDIIKYDSIDELSKLVRKLSNASERYSLPSLSADGAVIVYQDSSYIIWKVTSLEDLKKLSSWPPNDQPAWCTKQDHHAKKYLSTGPEYVCYKNGDPLWQICPKDPDNNNLPQFMNRHNNRMHSSKMMNKEAADLISKMLEQTGDTQTKEDMEYVFSIYKAPNLDDADTFQYLKEYVIVNGSAAKKDPKFLEVEQTYVRPRFLTAPRGMELDEIRMLTNKYNRTGEATKDYVDQNQFVAALIKKVKDCTSYSDLLKKSPSGTAAANEKFTDDEWGLAYRLDGVFKYVFELFDKEFSFKDKFNQMKAAMKEAAEARKKAAEEEAKGSVDKAQEAAAKASEVEAKVGSISGEMLSTLRKQFTAEEGGYYRSTPGTIKGFTYTYISERSGEQTENFKPQTAVAPYIKTIEQLSRPFIKAGFDNDVAIARKTLEEDGDVKAAYHLIESAGRNYQTRLEAESWERRNDANRETQKAIQDVVVPKLKEKVAEFTKIKDIRDFVVGMFPEEMKSRRSGDVRFNENNIPSWARTTITQRMEELRQLAETVREEREEKAQRGEIKIRFSPKREYERWYSNRNSADSTDPSDKVIEFVLTSNSYDINDRMQMLIDMKNTHDISEKWLLQVAPSIGPESILAYMRKHHNKKWDAMEAAKPAIVNNREYQAIAYKGQRIPAYEASILNSVKPRNDLNTAIDYIKAHLDGKPWPELEQKVVQEFNKGDWKSSGYWDNRNPSNLAEAILKYISEIKKSRWEEVEPKMFESDDYAFKYVFRVLPDAKERIRKLMAESQVEEASSGEKTSSRKILAKLVRALNETKRSK